jgi:hypothetical protein
MSSALPSLLQTAPPAAPFLFSEAEIPQELLPPPSTGGRYTAERLFSQRPEVYQVIVQMLAAKQGVRAIKKKCRVHHETIYAVAEREKLPIDTLKERIARDLEVAIHIGAERLAEAMETMPVDKLPLGLGITIDKHQLLTGGATVRVDHTQSKDDGGDSFEAYLDRVKRVDGRVITGLGGEGSGQMGAGRVHVLPGADPATDSQSPDSQRAAAEATGQDTAPIAASGASEPGGEGVGEAGGPSAKPTDSCPLNFISKGGPSMTPAGADGVPGSEHPVFTPAPDTDREGPPPVSP